MSDDDGDRDGVVDRVASRFDSESGDKHDKSDTRDSSSNNDNNEMSVVNVKDEWTARTVYLPDDLIDDSSKSFKRFDLELDDEFDAIRKSRHFYPLLFKLGLEQMEDMEGQELIELLEGIDPDLDDFLS